MGASDSLHADYGPYRFSKYAGNGLTRQLAEELRKKRRRACRMSRLGAHRYGRERQRHAPFTKGAGHLFGWPQLAGSLQECSGETRRSFLVIRIFKLPHVSTPDVGKCVKVENLCQDRMKR